MWFVFRHVAVHTGAPRVGRSPLGTTRACHPEWAELLAIFRRARDLGLQPLRVVIALGKDPAMLRDLDDDAEHPGGDASAEAARQ